jgi:hypothetical protein
MISLTQESYKLATDIPRMYVPGYTCMITHVKDGNAINSGILQQISTNLMWTEHASHENQNNRSSEGGPKRVQWTEC